MNAQFVDSKPKPAQIMDIFVAGVKIGHVELRDNSVSRYYAQIRLGDGLVTTFSFLQGFGETMEAAIDDAIQTSRQNAVCLLAKLDDLEEKLRGNVTQ